MARQRGVLMDIEGREAVVLTPRGEFKKIPAPGSDWDIGQEVWFEAAEPAAWRRAFSGRIAWLPAAAVLLLFLLIPAIFVVNRPAPVLAAYVTVDINPSIELSVDTRGRVIAATALNDDGGLVLAGLNLAGRPLDDAVEAIADRAAERGYLGAGKANTIIITTVPKDPAARLPRDLEEKDLKAKQRAEKIIREKGISGQVQALSADLGLRDAARKENLSIPKMMAVLAASEEGKAISSEEARKDPLAKILEKTGFPDLSHVKEALERNGVPKDVGKAFEKWEKEVQKVERRKKGDKDENDGKKAGRDGGKKNRDGDKDKRDGDQDQREGDQGKRDGVKKRDDGKENHDKDHHQDPGESGKDRDKKVKKGEKKPVVPDVGRLIRKPWAPGRGIPGSGIPESGIPGSGEEESGGKSGKTNDEEKDE